MAIYVRAVRFLLIGRRKPRNAHLVRNVFGTLMTTQTIRTFSTTPCFLYARCFSGIGAPMRSSHSKRQHPKPDSLAQ